MTRWSVAVVLLAAIAARADDAFVPLCIPRTVPPVNEIEVCLDGIDCYREAKGDGRTSAFVHGDPLATVYVRAFAAGEPIDSHAPWSHPQCDGFPTFRAGSLVVGVSLRLGHYYGPREQSWIAARQNQRGQAFAVDVNADGRITPADLAIIDGYAVGTVADDTQTLCIDYDCQ